ncbi:hypothetical protein IFM46972_10788 [Aspergillus udagawae]|uniref:Uncharacterized protein n=1 Tax=Aspergillus udagawae TaxID=91492 RepID=A0A8H3SDM9_9EURO|nr:hypothetical protein IFM46972_10788 [Aspergillus udagawae]
MGCFPHVIQYVKSLFQNQTAKESEIDESPYSLADEAVNWSIQRPLSQDHTSISTVATEILDENEEQRSIAVNEEITGRKLGQVQTMVPLMQLSKVRFAKSIWSSFPVRIATYKSKKDSW